jgi:hypothetical protein
LEDQAANQMCDADCSSATQVVLIQLVDEFQTWFVNQIVVLNFEFNLVTSIRYFKEQEEKINLYLHLPQLNYVQISTIIAAFYESLDL